MMSSVPICLITNVSLLNLHSSMAPSGLAGYAGHENARPLASVSCSPAISRRLNPQLPEQERIHIGEFFDLLGDWLPGAVAGFGFDSQQDRTHPACRVPHPF